MTTRVLENQCTEVLNLKFNVIFMSKHVLYTHTSLGYVSQYISISSTISITCTLYIFYKYVLLVIMYIHTLILCKSIL